MFLRKLQWHKENRFLDLAKSCQDFSEAVFDHIFDHNEHFLLIQYPGVAQLVGRLVWDQDAASSSLATRTKSPESASAESGLFCLHEVVCWLLFTRKNLFLHLFAKTVQNSIIGKINHVIQLILWKIRQIDGVPVRLLNRWTMVATNNLAWINHPIKVSYISSAF